MKWVGLTGGLGTGKSTVSRLLVSYGIPVLDADQIAKQVLEPGGAAYQSVITAFGPDICLPSGEIDRKKLAEKVFGRPKELGRLENLIHPLVQEEVKKQKRWLEEQGTLWAVYDVPLLFEKQLQNQFDYIVVVSASVLQQIQRVKSRNGWTQEEIKRRLDSQMPMKDKEAQADYVLKNDADRPSLEKEVATLVQMLNDRFHKEEV